MFHCNFANQSNNSLYCTLILYIKSYVGCLQYQSFPFKEVFLTNRTSNNSFWWINGKFCKL